MQVKFRHATMEDLAQVMGIIGEAKEKLRKENIDQWQNGYPSEAGVKRDIENKYSYVLEEDGKVIATVALCFGPEPDYYGITNGAWLSNQPYATIHRIAVKKNTRRGLADEVYAHLEKICINKDTYSVRADTHNGNITMQKFVLRQGFKRCGIIYLTGSGDNRAERVAFEKLLPRTVF